MMVSKGNHPQMAQQFSYFSGIPNGISNPAISLEGKIIRNILWQTLRQIKGVNGKFPVYDIPSYNML